MPYGVMRVVSCLCHIAQCVGGEIGTVTQTFEEVLRGNLFRSLSKSRLFTPLSRIRDVRLASMWQLSPLQTCGNRGEDDQAPSLAGESPLRSPEAPGVGRIRT